MIKKILVVPDSHFPYQDQRAFNLMCEAAKKWKPDEVIVMGDFVDCYSVSFHDKDPERVQFLKDEIKAARKGLNQLEALKAKNYVYIAGNHEYRTERYIMSKAPNLKGLVDVPDLLKLRPTWEYIKYKDYYKIGKMMFTHDLEKAGKYAVNSAVNDAGHNIIIGHLHRMASVYEGDAFGNSHVGACFGWLGNRADVDYKHRIKANRDWHLGFGLCYHDIKTGYVYTNAVPIVDYTCCLEGKVYRG